MKHVSPESTAVAIVGISCIFAQSPDLKAFFHVLARGVNAVSDPPETHRYLCDYYDPDPRKPDHIYCLRGGFLPQVDFDPSEFGIPPAALEATDTSQLLGLLVAKQALEDAGYGEHGKAFDRSKTSVILGVTGTQELVIPLGARLGHPMWRQALAENGVPESTADAVIKGISDRYVSWQENSFPGLLGNVVAGRIANRLNLGGTNCVIDAACASSMSAIHASIMELITGRSDMVLSGGVDTINDAFMHMCFAKTQILSSGGDIRPFSQDADGTVLGEGVGIMVLKRLADARRDGDRIYAVIRGVGTASDGRSQSIYAPRAEGQATALLRAYQDAGVDPQSIGLLEAHGTGTRVGDQVEFRALCDVFANKAAEYNRCALGSVKSNIGHTKAAAGTAGLIKAALSLYHKVLPPTLKALPTDPKLGVEQSPFYINHALRPWTSDPAGIRRAGVSSFGFGGSNFHAVLEEDDSRKQEPSWDGSVEIAAFSGGTKDALADQVKQWALSITPPIHAREIGRLAAGSRRRFNPQDAVRVVMVLTPRDPEQVLRTCEQALRQLESGKGPDRVSGESIFIGSEAPEGPIAFLFPGQGSQYVGMGRDLICCFPDSLEVFQSAERHIQAAYPLHEYLFPRLPGDTRAFEERLKKTDIAQPSIGAVSAAMLAVLTHFGIMPEAVCGHSYGELVALHAAGIIDRETLWHLSEARGRLMAQAGKERDDAGAMLAVIAPVKELAHLAESLEGLVLANRNSPHQGVLSGTSSAIDDAEKQCARNGWKSVRLPVAAAFHSSLVSSAQVPFQALVDQVRWQAPAIPVMSNSSGDVYSSEETAAKKLLGAQLATPVDFLADIENMHALGIRTFVEVGPKSVLTRLVDAILDGRPHQALPLDRSAGREFGLLDLARTLARLSALGHPVRLDLWEKPVRPIRPTRMRVPLSGANYRSVSKTKTASPAAPPAGRTKPTSSLTRAAAPPIRHDGPPAPATATHINRKDAGDNVLQPEHETMNSSKQTYLTQVLAAVQQGLASMQALQSQTTHAHEKYLEAQAEANRTLQQMIHSTQQLSAAITGDASATGIPAWPVRPPAPAANELQARPVQPGGATKVDSSPLRDRAVDSENSAVAGRINARTAAPETVAHSADDTYGSSNDRAPAKAAELSSIGRALTGIVSELTGYPAEMLGMEMDIEADLGIDSIKRVEILSALEEQMPHLPKVTPDMVGTLKTLGQICEFLSPQPGAAPPQPGSSVAPGASPGEGPAGGTEDIRKALTGIVGELTGYPEEMLGMEMDIEADLGIDSIKRVEILSALEEQMPHLPKVTPDMVGTLKTLGQICEFLSAGGRDTALSDPRPAEESGTNPEPPSKIARYEVRPVSLPHRAHERLVPPGEGFVGIICEEGPWGRAIADALLELNCPAEILNPEAGETPDERLSGLVICAPVAPWRAFEWAQKCASSLEHAAKHGQAVFVTVSRLDGAFGFSGRRLDDPEQGALAGLAKTAALEWPSVQCRALDVDPDWDTDAAAQAVALEIVERMGDTVVEVGLGPEARKGLQLVSAEPDTTIPLHLSSDDVVVVTGGARGVTAAAVLALADQTPCTVALLGRSPQPVAEPDWLAPLQDEGPIKKAILANEFPDESPSPKVLEKRFRTWMANREILQTMEAFDVRGIRAHYHEVDVRDRDAVAATLARIRRDAGPIKALIHGAGILEDRLIQDKDLSQFRAVYDTKVKGLLSLLDALESDSLHYLVLFSSISARMGNPGQADYAMANEVLNKLAVRRAMEMPDCNIVSINWGPWDGGMVNASLKRNFEKNGIRLIPLASGAAAMVDEMKRPHPTGVEVIIGSPLPSGAGPGVSETAPHVDDSVQGTHMIQTVSREIDLSRCPVLHAHLLGGRPVVPFALITEWLAHGALHANPGLMLHGMDHLRLLKGIAMDEQKVMIRLMAGSPRRKGRVYEVDVEVCDGGRNGNSLVHSRAKAILTDRLPEAPEFEENGYFKAGSKIRPLKDIYDRILFHGEALRGIEKIVRLSNDGMTAQLRCAPSPENWLDDPMRSRWIADPLVLDCAFQMAIIWCYEQQGLVCLPSYADAYRQYRDRFPADGVFAVLEVIKATDRKMVADFTFLDREKVVIARMTGYEAVMDPGLLKRFGVKAA